MVEGESREKAMGPLTRKPRRLFARWLKYIMVIVAMLPAGSASADSAIVRELAPVPGVAAVTAQAQLAAFAAGCFWGVEDRFRKVPGVLATAVGYEGGHSSHTSYEEVSSGRTGHAETVMVAFDPKRVSYGKLLDLFWEIHDPTTANRQGPDVGSQYRSVIFYFSLPQKVQAEASRDAFQRSGELGGAKIVTEVVAATRFHKAEPYHQQYVEKGGKAQCHFRKRR